VYVRHAVDGVPTRHRSGSADFDTGDAQAVADLLLASSSADEVQVWPGATDVGPPAAVARRQVGR
jgi:hypothetical protein